MPGRALAMPPVAFAPQAQGGQQYQPPKLPVPPAGLAQAQPPRPIVRMQSQDEPVVARPAPLVMPTPEQLGLGGRPAAREASVDWVAVHRRLDSLGCSCFQMDHPAYGGCKIICLLPTAQAGQSNRIEVQADNPSEAIQVLLQRTDALARR